jgi:hypothetical protein
MLESATAVHSYDENQKENFFITTFMGPMDNCPFIQK